MPLAEVGALSQIPPRRAVRSVRGLSWHTSVSNKYQQCRRGTSVPCSTGTWALGAPSALARRPPCANVWAVGAQLDAEPSIHSPVSVKPRGESYLHCWGLLSLLLPYVL